MALTSITTSTQQSILLHRMGSHTEGLNRLQDLLRSRNAVAGVPVKPRPTQLYVWQIPVNLLNVSIILFLIGLAIHIFATALTRDSKTWTDEKKVGRALGVDSRSYNSAEAAADHAGFCDCRHLYRGSLLHVNCLPVHAGVENVNGFVV